VSATETLPPPTSSFPGDDEAAEPGFVDAERAERRGGDLVVRSPPDAATPNRQSLFRRHVEGELGVGSARVWVGPVVPDFVSLTDRSAELTLLDATSSGLLAYYRDPVGASSCGYDSLSSCRAVATLYAADGNATWRLELDEILPRQRNLDIRDLSFGESVLYFNQACMQPSKEDKACDRLVAVDPSADRVLWRSDSFTATSRFLVLEDVIVSAAKGVNLPGSAVLLERATGRTLHRIELEKLPTRLEVGQEGVIELNTLSGPLVRLKVVDGRQLAQLP